MSIQAVKAVEIGDGFTQASQRGSVAHDAIAYDDSFVQGGGFIRRSDHAGGTEGGISSGAPIIAKAAMKPLSTLNRPVLETVDVVTHETAISFKERTDVTAVPALGVVAETMMALVLANEALRKFGGDTVEEFTRNHASYSRTSDRRRRPLVRAERVERRVRRPARDGQDDGGASARPAVALRRS